MKVYNDIESMYKAIEREVKKALQIEALKIQESMTEYIDKEIYGSYHELVYKRLNEFKNSATIKPVEMVGGEWYVEIYIPDTVHTISNIEWEGGEKTLSEIADYFADGKGFGRGGSKYDVIEDIEQQYATGKALKEVINYLKKNFDVY